MKLKLLSIDKSLIHVASSGTLTLVDVQGQDPLEDLLGAQCAGSRIMLDLGQTNYIDTAAISWFITRHKKGKEAGGCFVLHSVPPMVLRVLELLRMDEVLHIAEDEGAARSLAEGAKS